MTRENIIKQVTLTKNFVADAAPAVVAITDEVINGEILQVKCSFNQNGSVYLATSGLQSVDLFRSNASSGTLPSMDYPRKFGTLVGVGSQAGASLIPSVVNDQLILGTGSCVSGTAANLSVTVYYR